MDAATSTARPQTVEVAGPEPADLVDLARALIGHRGQRVAVISLRGTGVAGKSMNGGARIPTPDMPTIGPTFAQWLASPDSAPSKNQCSVPRPKMTDGESPDGQPSTSTGRMPEARRGDVAITDDGTKVPR